MYSVMYSVIHFTAIIFINNAFHLKLNNTDLIIHIMHSFHCLDS